MPKPVIAAINGFCLGADANEMACDIRITLIRANSGSRKSDWGNPWF